jgi:hypothetical protein
VVGEGDSGEGGEEGGPQRKDNKKKPDPDDPQFVPRGRFFMHDDRYGGKGPGPRPPRQRPDDAYDAEQEDIWMHDGYERLAREERDGRVLRTARALCCVPRVCVCVVSNIRRVADFVAAPSTEGKK